METGTMKEIMIFMLTLFVVKITAKESLTDEEILRKIDSFMEAAYSCHNNPALTLSVVKDGKVFLAKGYGLRSTDNIDENNKVTNQTLFGIASLSKAFTAALMMKILEDYDNITLKTRVADIFDDENVFYGDLGQHATLEDLLSHKLGIPMNNNIRLDPTLTRRTLVKRLRYLKPIGSFRNSFHYNNLVYGLATYITEVLGKQKWEELVRSKLFEPLGMTSSNFMSTADLNDLKKNDLATGYYDNGGDLYPIPVELSRRWGDLCGSGGVLSNAVDMAKWMMFHLEGGVNKENRRVLKKESLEACHGIVNAIPPTIARKYTYYFRPFPSVVLTDDAYGMAWELGRYRGIPVLAHSGSTFGYNSYVTLIPGINAGIFTAMTGADQNFIFRLHIMNYISDLLMGETPWLNETTACSLPKTWQLKLKPLRTDIPAQRDLTEYAGVYSNPAYGRMRVEVNQTTGLLNARYGMLLAELYPQKDADEFYAVSTGYMYHLRNFTIFSFESGKGNVITKLVVPSLEIMVPPVFVRATPSSKVRYTFSKVKSEFKDSCPAIKSFLRLHDKSTTTCK